MFSWSASFYPQPIYNFQRKSTAGLAIDFPTVNFLGFACYSIYTGAFLYSPLIRDQYAARYPASPDNTVRFNDFAFAVHATVLSIIIYTQFWPSIWGFYVSRFQRASKIVLALFWGCVIAPLVLTWVVLSCSPDGGYDPSTWAWIDVVSVNRKGRHQTHEQSRLAGLTQEPSIWVLDLYIFVYQATYHGGQICASGVAELQAAVNGGLEHRPDRKSVV